MRALPFLFLGALALPGAPDVPPPAETPAVSIPDPLVSLAGGRVTTAQDWLTQRRPELLELFRREIYGRNPVERPASMSYDVQTIDETAFGGRAVCKLVKLTWRGPGGEGSMNLRLYLPKATPPTGCLLLIVNRRRTIIDEAETNPSPFWPVEAILARGYATAAFHYSDVAVDRGETVFESGVFKVYGPHGERPADSWGALAAWAWGASRAIDFLAAEPSLAGRPIGVAGHSRGGKAALWCGAADPRVALAISNNSGTGGAALTRFTQGESLGHLLEHFPYWFAPNYRRFVGDIAALPVDQHELLALMAPRLVYVASAVDDAHAGPAAEFRSCVEAGGVYRLFGLAGVGSPEMPAVDLPRHAGAIGYHVRPGGHDLTVHDWSLFMDFADRHWCEAPAPR